MSTDAHSLIAAYGKLRQARDVGSSVELEAPEAVAVADALLDMAQKIHETLADRGSAGYA
jgi:hypothetical protein